MTEKESDIRIVNESERARPRRRWWLPWLIVGAALLVAGLLIATKPTPPPVEAQERSWRVSAEQVEPGPYRPMITLYGRIESLWSSTLTAGVVADVLTVEVIEGDFVAQGDLLVTLDDRDARLQLAQREAELMQAEARIASEIRRHEANVEALPREQRLLQLARSEVSRLQDLVENKVGAQSQLDSARQAAEQQAIALSARRQAVDEHDARLAEVEAARVRSEALRDQALLALERTQIHAPFNGRVSKVLVAPGKRVRVGNSLVELFDTDALIVRAQIPNRHLRLVRDAKRAGKSVNVTGEIDGQTIEATLRSLAGETSSGTGGVDALFALDRGGELVSQGRFVRLELELPSRDGLIALPYEALYGIDRIYVVDEQSRLQPMDVKRVGETRGRSGDARVLVSAPDLSADAWVVTTQLPNALDGLLVVVAETRKE